MTALIGIPIATLILGWQLGARTEQRKLETLRQKIESVYTIETQSGSLVADPEREVNLSLLWAVWRLLNTHFIAPEELDTRSLVLSAVRGLVEGVGDPYTVFMTPTESTEFHDTLGGKLDGIGAELSMRNGAVVVVAPIKGSPAARAGLLPLDVITHVNDQTLRGLDLGEVVRRIRGPKGSAVTLTIERAGAIEPKRLTITRDEITVPSVELEMKKTASGTVAILTMSQFGDTSVAEFRAALLQVRKEHPKGLIVDLRFNGGGYLEGAVDIVSFFLAQGDVVTVERRGGERETHRVAGNPIAPDLPLVVLINQGSASASEIVAGALQDHERATIIGMKSFGKGTVQEVLDLPGGSSLRVTVARWLLPSGKNLGKESVQPDVVVDRTPRQIEEEVDPQMEEAVKFLLRAPQ